MRFCFHPLRDKFVLINSWKDPTWTDVKIIRAGIDGDEKEKRELVFGKNLIDIQEKSVPQLLVDEVGFMLLVQCQMLILLGFSSILYLSDCESDTLVSG
jgi:cation-transporting P-type ATPase 13A2